MASRTSGIQEREAIYREREEANPESVFRASVNWSVAMIAQAARDLMLDTTVAPGMTFHQLQTKKENRRARESAVKWVKGGSQSSFRACVDCVNQALYEAEMPEIPFQTMRDILLQDPAKIAQAFPGTDRFARRSHRDVEDIVLVA